MIFNFNFSSWFDYNAIHSIEKRALPEFFNGEYLTRYENLLEQSRRFEVCSTQFTY